MSEAKRHSVKSMRYTPEVIFYISKPNMRKTAFFLMISLLGIFSKATAGFGFKLDGTLDKEAISHAYFEGEFHRVLPPLEMYRQSFPATATREDSIFVFKYLSVIYAADSTTRGKAESFMVQLLKLMPTIELIDLYISDNIQAIFKDVKKSFLEQQKYVRQHDLYGRPLADPINPDSVGNTRPGNRKGSKSWVWWTLGGVGTATIATVAYFAFGDEKKEADERIGVKP